MKYKVWLGAKVIHFFDISTFGNDCRFWERLRERLQSLFECLLLHFGWVSLYLCDN